MEYTSQKCRFSTKVNNTKTLFHNPVQKVKVWIHDNTRTHVADDAIKMFLKSIRIVMIKLVKYICLKFTEQKWLLTNDDDVLSALLNCTECNW